MIARSRCRLIVAVLALSACEPPRATPSPEADLPRITGTVDLTIGAAEDAPDEYQFGNVRGLAFAPDGGILVADGAYQTLRMYDSTGRFLTQLAREGAGPGELRRPSTMGFGPDSLLWVLDEGNRRWTAFRLGSRGTEFVRTVPRRGGGTSPIAFDPEGFLVNIFLDFSGSPMDESSRPVVVRLITGFDGNSGPADTIRIPPPERVGELSVTTALADGSQATDALPFSPGFLMAHSIKGDYATAISSRYEVDWRDSRGGRIRLVTRAVPAIPRSARERRFFERAANALMEERKLNKLPFDTPSAKPILETLAFDTDGNLWVVRQSADREPAEADIFDRSGNLTAVAVLPSDHFFDPLLPRAGGLAPREMLTLSFDTLGTTRVVRVRFR